MPCLVLRHKRIIPVIVKENWVVLGEVKPFTLEKCFMLPNSSKMKQEHVSYNILKVADQRFVKYQPCQNQEKISLKPVTLKPKIDNYITVIRFVYFLAKWCILGIVQNLIKNKFLLCFEAED